MNYYKVGMNYELHMVYIPYHNNEKGICMNLLLVEDDLNLGKILKRQMEDHGITVTLCTTGKQGTELIYSGGGRGVRGGGGGGEERDVWAE